MCTTVVHNAYNKNHETPKTAVAKAPAAFAAPECDDTRTTGYRSTARGEREKPDDEPRISHAG